jgi:hypothetical protein
VKTIALTRRNCFDSLLTDAKSDSPVRGVQGMYETWLLSGLAAGGERFQNAVFACLARYSVRFRA